MKSINEMNAEKLLGIAIILVGIAIIAPEETERLLTAAEKATKAYQDIKTKGKPVSPKPGSNFPFGPLQNEINEVEKKKSTNQIKPEDQVGLIRTAIRSMKSELKRFVKWVY